MEKLNKMVDIIVLVHNQPEITEKFFKRVKQYTSPNYRLIVVNNGSDVQTDNIIKQYADKVIRFEENVGFTIAVNKALDEVKAPYFCLINNDILVTPNWLEKLRMKLKRVTKAGAISAITNFTLGKQRLMPEDLEQGITDENYEKIKITVDPAMTFTPATAEDRTELKIESNNLDKIWKTNFLGFFCVLFKSEVLNKIGKLDEQFSPAYDEDLDYCFRMRNAGYDLLIDRETFVYHYGEVTAKDVLNKNEQYQISRQKLLQKWGQSYFQRMTLLDPDFRRLDPQSVTIGLPNQGSVSHYFMMDILQLLKPPGTAICEVPRTITHIARQECVKFALSQKTNWLFFVDTDVRFPPDILVKFLSYKKDLVMGIVHKRVPPYNPCVYKGRKKMVTGELGWIWLSKKGIGLIEIDGGGMAATLINMKVFRDTRLEEPYFYFDKRVGEDLRFCERIQKLGYKLYCDTDIECLHEGEPVFHGWNDFTKWAVEHGGQVLTGSDPKELSEREANFLAQLNKSKIEGRE